MPSKTRRISTQAILVFLRATAANSLKTCTLTVPPSAINSSAWSERGSSWMMAYRKTFVSKNALSLIALHSSCFTHHGSCFLVHALLRGRRRIREGKDGGACAGSPMLVAGFRRGRLLARGSQRRESRCRRLPSVQAL